MARSSTLSTLTDASVNKLHCTSHDVNKIFTKPTSAGISAGGKWEHRRGEDTSGTTVIVHYLEICICTAKPVALKMSIKQIYPMSNTQFIASFRVHNSDETRANPTRRFTRCVYIFCDVIYMTFCKHLALSEQIKRQQQNSNEIVFVRG